MTITLFIILVLLGLVVGFYSGLIGTGGNILLIPALDYLFVSFGVDAIDSVRLIIAHSLFITVFLGMLVSHKHYRIGNFFLNEVLIIGVPGMISAFLVTELIKATEWYNKQYFDIFFLSLLILLAFRMLFFNPQTEQKERASRKKPLLIGLGFVTGGVTSLSGLGGGVTMIPFLTDIMKVSIKKASSISIGVITLLAAAVSFSYGLVDTDKIQTELPIQMGYISLGIVIPIVIGVMVASSFGVRTAQKTSPARLRIIFGVIVGALCLKMIFNLLPDQLF